MIKKRRSVFSVACHAYYRRYRCGWSFTAKCSSKAYWFASVKTARQVLRRYKVDPDMPGLIYQERISGS